MTTDAFLAARPRVRPDIVLGPSLLRGAARIHLLKDPRTGRRLEVGAKEHFIITRLDGTRSLEEIGQAYSGVFGTRLGEAQWGQMLRLLGARGLLDGGPAPIAPAPVPTPAERPSGFLSGHTRMVADAPALMDRLHRLTALDRRPALLAVLTALAVGVLAAVALSAGTLWRQTVHTAEQPVLLFAVGCVLWCSLALHELAHGLFARTWGGRVSEIGLRWILGATYLYCQVDDVQFLGSRARKVATACAGVLANLLFLVPFHVAWLLLPADAQARPAFGALLLLGVVTGLANLLPLAPLDGYRALGHALGVSGLAEGSRAFTALAARALLRRGPGLGAYPPRLRLLYGGFALLTAAQTAALLALAGLVLRHLLPDSLALLAWWLPTALLAAALLLWGLGNVGRRLRGRRTEDRTESRTEGRTKSRTEDPAASRAEGRTRGPGESRAPGPARSAASTSTSPGPGQVAGARALLDPARKGEMNEPHAQTGTAPGPATTEPVVVLDGVIKRYGEVTALDGVSLTVRRGEFFGILGPNGAGKTTLVEIVEGMREADGGTVSLLGQSPWPRDTALLARIGVQTQASAFFARLTAGEHLRTVAALYGMDPDAVRIALERVGLTEKKNARVDHLSGGQRQRLAIATALLHEPELIFLDEPTAALDPEARRELWALLRSLRSEGRTIVCTTHHLDEAEALCDRVAIVADGRIIALDTPRGLIRSLAAPARLLLPAAELTPEAALALPGVDRATVEGDELVLETSAVNHVLTALGDLVDIESVTVRTATLEDAYLSLTGHGTEHRS
ncbi:ATP-binding cassette domain-containing protein [Streptomyces incarnatus]